MMQDTPHNNDDVVAGTNTSTETPRASVANDSQVVADLAKLSAMDYDRVRKPKAKELGVQVSTLDEQVKAARNAVVPVELLPFQDWEPYPEEVDLALVLSEIAEVIHCLVIVDHEQADGLALWVSHTYVPDAADTSPLAIFNAPERECAKTLLQTVAAKMSRRPLQASNASQSAIFRAVDRWKSTVFIDEADTFFKDNPELAGLVNAGFNKGGFVLRSESTGDSFEPTQFSVYGPKSIAGIALERHLPDATMSRGIVFNLRRKLPHETVQRLRYFDKSVFQTIARKLTRFAQDYSAQLLLARPHLPDELSDRQQDCWEPLLAIAQIAGGDWPRRALQAALILSKAGERHNVSTGNELLADIQDVFESKKAFKIPTVDLIEALVADPEKGWATYNRGKPVSPRQLAKQLATYDIHSKTVRMANGSTPKGYDADQFADAFARYLAAPEKLPQRRNDATQPAPAVSEKVAYMPQQNDPGGLDAFLAELEAMEQGVEADVPGDDCGGVADTSEDDGDDASALNLF